jgi:peptide/nickel transport system substrate-binding protein
MKIIFNSLFRKWLKLPSKKKILSFLFLSFLLAGIFLLSFNFICKFTTLEPEKGGVLRLGVIGRPSYVNPVLAQSNDCDKDLIELIYDGLYSIDGEGKLIANLSEKTEVSEDGRTYIIFLKDNVYWHDGMAFTADDVIFTIETIQDPSIRSPLRLNWAGVVVEKLGIHVVRFNLKSPYEPFLQNLTLKIIPKHIWENIESRNFLSADYNLKPIGTGPYLFNSLEKNKAGKIISYSLAANENYFQKEPFISQLIFHSYDNYDLAKSGLLKKEIDGFSPVLIEDIDFFENKKNTQIASLFLPRYYAVFLNSKNPLFDQKEIREALDLAIPHQELVTEILKKQAFLLGGPFTSGFLGEEFNLLPEYSPEKAKEIIKELEEDQRKFVLSLPDNLELIRIANYLKTCWEKIGVSVELQILPLATLEKEIIQTRSYDALLFGEIIGQDPDLFSFWHSSQVTDPGLNLSAYQNKDLDELLEKIRQDFDKEQRMNDMKIVQDTLFKDKPALFLYNPFYLYVLPKKIKGNNIQYANLPSEKFSDIENWYIYTKRTIINK